MVIMDESFGSAFPKPPDVFKSFTDENIANDSNRGRYEAMPGDPPNRGTALASQAGTNLSNPPPSLSGGHFTSFGDLWPVNERLPSLTDMGVQSLIPDTTNFDRGKELQKLADSLLLNFLELLDTLVINPLQFAQQVDHLRLIFINMHYLINEYRPHQARETLKLLLNDQLQRKRQQTIHTRQNCAQLKSVLLELQTMRNAADPEGTSETPLSDVKNHAQNLHDQQQLWSSLKDVDMDP